MHRPVHWWGNKLLLLRAPVEIAVGRGGEPEFALQVQTEGLNRGSREAALRPPDLMVLSCVNGFGIIQRVFLPL